MKLSGTPFCLAIVILAAHMFVPLSAATLEEETQAYRADLTEGISLLRSGNRENFSRAIGRFKNALKLRPESAEAYFWIALANSDLNNYRPASDFAKNATIYDDRMAEAWLLWGQCLLYLREWNEALQKLETAARLAPDDPRIQYNLGRVYYHGFKDPDSALPRFRAVWQNGQTLRRENPENALLVVNSRLYMGYCEFDRKQWKNAINAFLDVLREQPGNYDAALRLALAYRHSSYPNECEQLLLDMLKVIPPDTPINRQMLAEVNLQLVDFYLKDPVKKNSLFVRAHLREFINQVQLGNLNHPQLEIAREYLAQQEREDSQQGGAQPF